MSQIFISYRRDDSAGYAGRLYDRLSQHFGDDNIFMDIVTIEPGLDFVEVIETVVGSCDVLVAVIGPQWLTITDATGQRRLDNPADFVRLEIKTALDRNIRVIPALIRVATMPRSHELPDGLKRLSRRNALKIGERFHPDVDRLIDVIQKLLGPPGSAPSKPKREKQKPTPILQPRQPFEPEMILIPAGEFLMGSDPNKDKDAQEEEQPQHTLYLPDYDMAKTPITNAQFMAFVRGADYQTTAEEAGYGWGWTGNSKIEEVKGANWQHPQGPNSNISGKSDHPVVYISLHDAIAYCNWLSKETGQTYRLPTEAEWEKAARGPAGLIYPWGNQRDKRRCNTVEGGQRDTTPVGAYPLGASPYGLLDMAGNVWEWTLSLWGKEVEKPDFKYPYKPEDGRENLEAGDEYRRVLRGGSWFDDQYVARCAYRFYYHPRFRNFYLGVIGCRVVVSPI